MITKPIYIISDLHLGDAHPEIVDAFERFIDVKARHAHALYILGDLFEVWVGDDEDSTTAKRVKERLKQLSEHGVPVFYMRGNRDFLVGKSFLDQADIHLLPDPSVVSFDDHDVLLTHGDLLCTHDKRYQRFRFCVHLRWFQALFLALPRAWRQRIAQKLRMTSDEMGTRKSVSLMDVNEETVETWLKQYQVFTLIHGHTHRPFKHFYPLTHPPYTRFVLGAWDQGNHPKILSYQAGELSLVDA